YYRFTGEFTDRGSPVFEDPVPALQAEADLYAGSLPVPNAVDWDGDGDLDIVAGNSEGFVLFFENAGSNADPKYRSGVHLKAGGETVHIQPGYRLDIQGPFESRWGYVCPTVADWNEDGLPDLLMSDSTARHFLYLNAGEKTEPRLDHAKPLYLDGLELHGTWRVKPGVAKLGDRMAYVALDDDDQFHLYWRIDDQHLEEGGKLRLEDGSPIGANFLSAGGSGRLKINLHDWDQDGKVDLIVGTPRHGSVPNPEAGLPQSLGLPGSAVLFLKNTSSNAAPRYRFPIILKFRGENLYFGQHACGPATVEFSTEKGADLAVGAESGRIHYFARKDLSWEE
ncbi:MAG: VCBS repeat-containing protein, partial [Candidatus Omnitrophica bacterium]|nr:VCBS repeat-containing protein [Candidatus Omnitrophota bacterium]